jgi:hypothetical protein
MFGGIKLLGHRIGLAVICFLIPRAAFVRASKCRLVFISANKWVDYGAKQNE